MRAKMEPWTRQILIVVVSQICKTLGWHSISTTCLQVLVDVLDRYLKRLGTTIHEYSELFNRTAPALEEIDLSFADMGINIEDLKEYIDYVSPIMTKLNVPKYPLEKKSNLNFLKPGSREVVTRPVHIHEHLPAMYPLLDNESYSADDLSLDESKEAISNAANYQMQQNDMDDVINKRLSPLKNVPTRPVRVLNCVTMTSSGFLSHDREGKLPEPRLPKIVHNFQPQPISPQLVEEKKLDHKEHKEHKKTHSSKNKNKTREENYGHGKEHNDGIRKISTSKDAQKKPSQNSHTPLSITKIDTDIKPVETDKKSESYISKESRMLKHTNNEKLEEGSTTKIEEKLTTEPSKQKLDIFRRISKIKEDRIESTGKIAEEKNSVSDSIESVIKQSSQQKEPSASKILQDKKIKRKKKEKPSVAGESSAKKSKLSHHKVSSQPPNVNKKTISCNDDFVTTEKPTVPELPPYLFLTPNLMPDALKSNLLIPTFSLINNLSKIDPNSPHPEMPNLPLPPPMMQSAVQEKSKSTIKVLDGNLPVETMPLSVSNKKIKKKMKKDKREKDKLKRKEKKGKIKIKQDRLEEKLKVKSSKKEKLKKKQKLNLVQKSELKEDASTLPKLKLILNNGPNSPQPSTSGLNSPKIFIKPIVKPEESAIEPTASLFSSFPSKPSKVEKKSKVILSDPILNVLSPKPSVDTTKVSFSKSKNMFVEKKSKKEKIKKRTDELKSRPDPFYYDAEGNQIWICPTCKGPDNGTPMIGCDGCDAWYHWECVGIQSAPESPEWYCGFC